MRQLNCRSLRCSWSIACRRCSNYIFILHSTLALQYIAQRHLQSATRNIEVLGLGTSYIRDFTVCEILSSFFFLTWFFKLTHWDLVMPYVDIDLNQHLLKWWPVTCTNFDLSSVWFSDTHGRAMSQEIPQPSITKIRLKIIHLKFHSDLPGANELILSHLVNFDLFSHKLAGLTVSHCPTAWGK